MFIIKKLSFNKLNGFDTEIHWHEGGDLLRRARKMRLRFEFIKEPKYTYSFRRFRVSNKFNLLSGIARFELARFINKKVEKDKAKIYYPMEGGSFYQIDPQKNKNIEKFINEVFNQKSFEKKSIHIIKGGLNMWKRIFG